MGAAARQCAGNDAGAGGAEAVRVEVGVLQGHLVEKAGAAVTDRFVVVDPEIQQHGLLEPFVDDPAAVAGFGDAQFAGVEAADAMLDGLDDFGTRICRRKFATGFPRRFDRINQLRHGPRSPGCPYFTLSPPGIRSVVDALIPCYRLVPALLGRRRR